MPNYTYRCKKCLKEFDVEQSIHDSAFTQCKEISESLSCEGNVFRLIGRNVGVQFLGSGFYINDNNTTESTASSSKDG